jgi:hypothetical protein
LKFGKDLNAGIQKLAVTNDKDEIIIHIEAQLGSKEIKFVNYELLK